MHGNGARPLGASISFNGNNARAFGVRDYLAQFMFNSPPGTSDAMDLAKMLACLDLIEPLAREPGAGDPGFAIYRQVRTGLLSYPTDPDEAPVCAFCRSKQRLARTLPLVQAST